MISGAFLRVAFGGLTYQIEHHLFPSMPSRNLRHCRPIVKAFCADRGVEYCETGLFASYGRVLGYLGSVRPSQRGRGRGPLVPIAPIAVVKVAVPLPGGTIG